MTQSKNKTTDIDKELSRLEYSLDKGINFKDRIILITGEIEESSSFNRLEAALCEMERDTRKGITIRINSGGGSVYEALAMVGRIENSRCHITTECYGHAMSAAGLILSSGSKRRMSRRAWFMYHEIMAASEGSISEIEDQVFQLRREMHQWADAMTDLTTESLEFWKSIAKRRDCYLSAEECLKYGIVDEIF